MHERFRWPHHLNATTLPSLCCTPKWSCPLDIQLLATLHACLLAGLRCKEELQLHARRSGDCHAPLLPALRCSPSGLAARRSPMGFLPLLTEEPPPAARCSLSWRCSHGRPLFGARCSRPWKLLRCLPGEGPLLARATARRERAAARPCHCSPGRARRRAAACSWMALLAGVPLPAAGWRYSQACRCSPASLLANHCSPWGYGGRSHVASVASTKRRCIAHYLVSVSDAVTRCMISLCPLHGDWKARSSTMLACSLASHVHGPCSNFELAA
ncbi:hypothetical protein Dimus_025256 [Dionaea muscipula]